MENKNIIYETCGKKLHLTFIHNLKRVLEQFGIKQIEFAKQIGVSKQTLNNYLSMRRILSLDKVCVIIYALKDMIPNFNTVFLFDNNQDIILHGKTNNIYDEQGTLINKLDDGSLNILYKILRNEFLPSFLKSIVKYFSTSDASAHEHITVSEMALIDNFIKGKSVRVILKYLILLLYDLAPDNHIINHLHDIGEEVVNQDKQEIKELVEIHKFLIEANHKRLKQ